MIFQGIIFDLDGVICSTDEYHYQAWKELADREGIPFDRSVNPTVCGAFPGWRVWRSFWSGQNAPTPRKKKRKWLRLKHSLSGIAQGDDPGGPEPGGV